MASDYIQRLLEEARAGSSGVFSLDLSRVELVFGAGGQDWLQYWLRFACFYGGDPISINWEGNRFSLEFSSQGPDSEGLRSLLLDSRRGPRYLALGMLAAAQQGLSAIEFQSPRGYLSLHGQRSRLEEGRRSRDGSCRLTARLARGLQWRSLVPFALPYRLNGQLQKPLAGLGLRLLVDGWAFAWDGPPLLPPGENLDYPIDDVFLDALLLNPRLESPQICRLQNHFQATALERCRWSPETVEWLLLRDPQLVRRLPAPPAWHALYPAYCERQAWLAGSPPWPEPWASWPECMWPFLLDQGLAPDLPEWLQDTCRRLPPKIIYRYLLRRSWMGDHRDPQLLTALLCERRDRLSAQVMLARQLGFLLPAQRPEQAWRFCREFLTAAVQGDESPEQWQTLNPWEQAEIRKLLEDL